MAKIRVLVDTDIFIDYLNTGALADLFEDDGFEVYFSIITEKELLTKPGISDSEKRAIIEILSRYRRIPLTDVITALYSRLRAKHSDLPKEDALIAATALSKNLPVLTRNKRHFRIVTDLVLFGREVGVIR